MQTFFNPLIYIGLLVIISINLLLAQDTCFKSQTFPIFFGSPDFHFHFSSLWINLNGNLLFGGSIYNEVDAYPSLGYYFNQAPLHRVKWLMWYDNLGNQLEEVISIYEKEDTRIIGIVIRSRVQFSYLVYASIDYRSGNVIKAAKMNQNYIGNSP